MLLSQVSVSHYHIQRLMTQYLSDLSERCPVHGKIGSSRVSKVVPAEIDNLCLFQRFMERFFKVEGSRGSLTLYFTWEHIWSVKIPAESFNKLQRITTNSDSPCFTILGDDERNLSGLQVHLTPFQTPDLSLSCTCAESQDDC